jgi:hypothetical protein
MYFVKGDPESPKYFFIEADAGTCHSLVASRFEIVEDKVDHNFETAVETGVEVAVDDLLGIGYFDGVGAEVLVEVEQWVAQGWVVLEVGLLDDLVFVLLTALDELRLIVLDPDDVIGDEGLQWED